MKNKLQYQFDQEADILYLTQKKPSVRDISEEIADGIVVRINPKTKKIVGLTILNFLSRYHQTSEPVNLPISAEFAMAR